MELSRRHVLGMSAAAAVGVPAPDRGERADLTELGIAELQHLMAAGRLDAVRLTKECLRRIERMDRRGPTLRAVIEVDPDALRTAARLDTERRDGRVRGPLHGIPILLKDNLDTADSTHTTAGSLALLGSRPKRDATIADRLRRAGVVPLGKANMSEWAGGMTLVHRAGWSARGGQCRNPYRLDRSPSESSSGTAVAVSVGLCVAGIGTETNGSILGPSSVSCVVGIKPTVGLTSRAGVVPGTVSFDSVGPIGRSVADAAAMLGTLVGVDPRDPATAASAGRFPRDYTRFLDPNGLRGTRIGVPRNVYFGYSHHADAVADKAIEALRAAGATVVDPADIPTAQEIEESTATAMVMAYEVKRGLDTYLAATPGEHPRSLAEVIEFNRQHAEEELRYFPQDALEAIDAMGGEIPEATYREALRVVRQLSRERGIDAVLRAHRLDALVMPTEAPPGKIDLINGDNYLGGSSGPAALAGYPAISVPAGFAFGLPVGLTFMGTAWSEPTLIRLAYAFEQATKARRAPEYKPGEVGL